MFFLDKHNSHLFRMAWNVIWNLTMSNVDGRGISTIHVSAQLLLYCKNEITLYQKHLLMLRYVLSMLRDL